jgi:LmbE family N-acetylglucosaminyl deacetylase
MTTPSARPVPPAGDRQVSLEVRTVVSDGTARHLHRWAGSLDASVRRARKQTLVGSVAATIWDQTIEGVTGLDTSSGGVDSWAVVTARPASGHPVSDLILLVDPTVDLSPSCLGELLMSMRDPKVGIVEPRHIPFQSRKPLDPDTAEVSWGSAGCCLIRGQVLDAIGGFDFELGSDAGADVDLSWRARMAGWSVRCAPSAAVFDHSPVPSGEPLLEPSQASSLAKLRLAARYAGPTAAEAWATAWRIKGRPGEKQAAVLFEGAVNGPFLGSDSGIADAFTRELFNLQQITDTVQNEYALRQEDMRTCPTGPAATGTEPFLSVIVRTQGTRLAELEDNLLSLAAQGCADFEVLLMGHDLDDTRRQAVRAIVGSFPSSLATRVRLVDVAGGGRARPLNVALGEATGRYVAFLDDDDVALASWVGEFARVADRCLGAVVWSQVAWQVCESMMCAGRPLWRISEGPTLFVRRFDLFAHLRQNGTPNCAVAIPRALITGHGLEFREDVNVYEDWDMILRLAQLAPFEPTGTVTALYRRGSADGSGEIHDDDEWDSSSSQLLDDMDRSGFVIRGEYLPGLRDALDELDEFRRDAEEEPNGPALDLDAVADARAMDAAYLADRKVVVVGPHLDDAVLSCGALMSTIEDATVVTVFAGEASDWNEMTPWDEACGFSTPTNVVAARMIEDDQALSSLGCTAVRLPFLDEQYRDATVDPDVGQIGQEILNRIRAGGAEVVFIPLGLGHADHRLAAEACLWAARHAPELDWFAYQDLPYAYEGGEVAVALAGLDGLAEAVSFPPPDDPTLKMTAVSHYESQLKGLGEERVALALKAERYWQLTLQVTTDSRP